MKKLDGRVAVITGAASGIGRETCVALAQQGCSIALVDINQQGLEQSAELIAQFGVSTSMHIVDVTNKEQMQQLPESVLAEHGHIHILANNAGVSIVQNFNEQSIEDIEWIVGINLWGVIYGCKYFIPYMMKEDEAHIVNISSLFGLASGPGQSSYGATKFAVRGLSESLYVELYPDNIGVSCIYPGTIKTNIISSSRGMNNKKLAEIQGNFDRFGISPEIVARKIVGAIKSRKLHVRISPETYLIDWLKRYFPNSLQKFVAVYQSRKR